MKTLNEDERKLQKNIQKFQYNANFIFSQTDFSMGRSGFVVNYRFKKYLRRNVQKYKKRKFLYKNSFSRCLDFAAFLFFSNENRFFFSETNKFFFGIFKIQNFP